MPAPQTTLPDPPDPSPTPASKASTDKGGVKETIESILVAFILAFVFRAFVVEAFVIPTGSMATTLLGAHTRFQCPDCGYQFDVNYTDPRGSNNPDSDELPIPATAGNLTGPIYCPNCGFEMTSSQTNDPPVFYGDRLLVLKYLYLLQKPQRWDVVVFKAPTQMTVNYIKRLIGTPGESVMILDGDVYIREPGSDQFVIQTKPKPAQDALWRLVYDNDFHPEGSFIPEGPGHVDRVKVGPWTQPWTVVDGSGWNLDDAESHGRTFTFNGDNKSSILRFATKLNPNAQGLNDYLIYDQQPIRNEVLTPVSDVDLRLTYQRHGGTGPLELTLTKRDHTFIAQISPTQATLYHDYKGVRKMIGSPMPLPAGDKPMRIDFTNADYQVTLRINDTIAAQSTPADFSPDIPALIREYNEETKAPAPQIEISAANQQSAVSHLSLWRDVYYYNRMDARSPVLRADPGNFPRDVAVLKPDEYFVMGDNSRMSFDARCWPTGVHLPAEDLDVEAGRVPGRFLLGKAFYVYWPAGYVAHPMLPAFVPNFGAMRFIH